LGGTAYVQYKTERPAPFEGRAWVYQNLEDADRAVCSSSIPPQSVIVLQNCVGVDVTAIVNVICGADRTDIAVATDGTCELTDVLVVQIANPNSFANEEFANIQNGDQLEIDPAKGRFNSNVLSKDLKNRAKRNGERKPVIYF
jgi:dihydroxyacid dehydratase/phosphogluconate dehydratase